VSMRKPSPSRHTSLLTFFALLLVAGLYGVARDMAGNASPPSSAHTKRVGFLDAGTEPDAHPPGALDDILVLGRDRSAAGGSLPVGWLVLLLALPLMHSRRTRSIVLRSAASGWLVLCGLSSPDARAQPLDPSRLSQSIDMQRYKPGPNATDVLGVHGGQVGRGWNLKASFNYAYDPLGLFDRRQGHFIYRVLATQMTLDLMGSYSCDRFELGVALPLTYQASERRVSEPPVFLEGVSGSGVGDLRLVSKVRLFSSGGFHLGAVVPVVLPTAGATAFRGGAGLAVQFQVVGEWTHGSRARVVANLGVHLRKQERLHNLLTGNEMLYALGVQVPLFERFTVQAQLAGALGLVEGNEEERPLEVLASLQYRLNDWLRVHVGGGPGLSRGYGTPSFRLFAGIGWSPPR